VTGRDDYLMAARDVIVAWASYERRAWLPKGFLWGDTAIVSRISKLAEFWRLYRNHPSYQPEVAKIVLGLVARSGQFLANPAHFTFNTGHGISQNLGLWHLCVAFPALPNTEHYRQLALERMRDQMKFWVSNEGVVTSYSASYQSGGLLLMARALRYSNLLHLPICDDFVWKFEKAKDVYAQLRRPDKSLPMFGDTYPFRSIVAPLVMRVDANGKTEMRINKKDWIPKQSHTLYPVSGYTIWWNSLDEWPNEERLKQTVVTWSHFPGHAHKHADEMSVLLWASGETWWTNVGYWPYGTKGRQEAKSWAGSNAPHLVGESNNSVRNTKLKQYGWSDHLAFIDLERRGPNEYVARRQVVQAKPNLWIVADHTLGNENDKTTTTWTTSHDVQLREGTIPGSYFLDTGNNSARLTKFLFSSGRMKTIQLQGSFSPFAGWDFTRPAPAILIEQPANDSWSVAIWSLQNASEPHLKVTAQPYMKQWKSPEFWKIAIPHASGLTVISRENERIYYNSEDKHHRMKSKELILTEPPDVKHELNAIHAAFKTTASKYPRKNYSMHLHFKATFFIFLIFSLQEAFFLIYTRIDGRHNIALRSLSLLGWMTIGIWFINKVYL